MSSEAVEMFGEGRQTAAALSGYTYFDQSCIRTLWLARRPFRFTKTSSSTSENDDKVDRMSRQRVQRAIEADGLVREAERLTQGRLFLTKDVETPPELRAQRIREINQELRRIEIRLARL